MRKAILSLAIASFMTASVVSSFGQETDKKATKARENLKEANRDVADAKHDLNKAEQDSASDYQRFRKECSTRISDNEKNIAEYKLAVKKEKKATKAKNEKKLAALELKNKHLKAKLAAYRKDEAEAKWEAFKKGFNHDVDEVGGALKDFAAKITD
jgi:hypothetical protein